MIRYMGLRIASALVAGIAATQVSAQVNPPSVFPNKPVRVIVPQTASSSADFFARLVGEMLSEKWKVPVVIDNRPGAGGGIAMETVVKANADGYTITVTTEGSVAILPHLNKQIAYDTLTDLLPITRVALAPYVIVVHPSLPVKSVKDLIGYAVAKPGQINFASGGNGTGTHLSGELFKIMSGTNIVHVPYKGASLGLTDVIGGHVQMMFVGLPPAIAQIKAGKLLALGVTTLKRNFLIPNVPTVAESGLPKFEVAPWWGVLVPARTPLGIAEKLNADISEVVRSSGYRRRLEDQGAEPMVDAISEFKKLVKEDYDKWGNVVRSAGVRVQ